MTVDGAYYYIRDKPKQTREGYTMDKMEKMYQVDKMDRMDRMDRMDKQWYQVVSNPKRFGISINLNCAIAADYWRLSSRARRAARVRGKGAAGREKDAQVREKDAQVREKDAQVREKDAQVREKDAQVRVSSCFKSQTVWDFNQLELRYRGRLLAVILARAQSRACARGRLKG